MSESEIPKGWTVASLADLVPKDGVFTDGDWVESKDQDPDGAARLIQLADVGAGSFRDRSNRFMTIDKVTKLRCTTLEEGDILVARMPEPLGRACLYPGTKRPAVTVVDVCIIRMGMHGVNKRWLMWAINSPQIRRQIDSYQTGTTRKRISRKNLEKIVFKVPPLAEQNRIVEALEAHLSHLDAAMVLLDRISQATSALRMAHLREVSEPLDGSGTDWEVVTFGDVVKESRGGWSRSHHHLVPADQGTPYLKMNNITTSGRLKLESVVYVTTSEQDLEKYSIREGDILFNNKNSAELVGKTAVAGPQVAGWVFNENISRIRLIDSVIPEFAVLQMNSPRFRNEIREMRSASTNVAAIYTRDLKRASFFVPPADVQRTIIAKHANLSYGLDRVNPILRAARQRGDALRRALLRQAISGKLIPQDPTDEPATVLLNCIRPRPLAGSVDLPLVAIQQELPF